MRLGPQPRGRTGSADRPYSPLNLRLVLASIGLVASVTLSLVLFRAGNAALAWVFVILAGIAVVDLVVIQLRRRARARAGERRHSLFE